MTKFRPTTENHTTGTSQAARRQQGDNQSILLVVEGWMLADAADDVIADLRTLSKGTMPLAITEIHTLPHGKNKDLKPQYIRPYCKTCVHHW